MRKGIVGIMLVAFLMIVFTACKNNEVDKNFTISLEEVYENIINAQGEVGEELVLLPETNEDYIDELYSGLNDIEIEEKALYVHPIGIACEIALVRVKNSADIENVKTIFEQRIEKGVDSIMCDSESQDIWRTRAQVQTKGNYICMIVLPDEYTIPQNVFDFSMIGDL